MQTPGPRPTPPREPVTISRIEPLFRRDLQHAKAVPVAVLAGGCAFLVLLVLYVARLHGSVDAADVALARGNLIFRLAAQRDAALKAFLLSRNQESLAEFNMADAQLAPAFDALQELLADQPAQLDLVRAARVEVIRCRHYAAQQVDRVRDGASSDDIADHLEEGGRIIGEIRRQLQQFMTRAEQVRSERLHRADTVTWYLLVGGVVIGLVLGGAISSATARRMQIVRARYRDAMSEQRRTEKALAAANARLRQTDARKDEFLGMLSHELRNPLAPIKNSVYVLGRAAPGTAADRRARTIIERQVEHLTRLVDDLLDVKRLSVGKMRLDTHDVDLVPIVRETVEDVRALFTQRSIELRYEAPRERVPVRGDPVRLSQVVSNLLHNALKFTDPGGHVFVTLDARDRRAHLRVRDDGVGVSPELMPRLFDSFAQGETTLERSRGGLGLGLALVRGLVELHGGTVTARSEGVGRGTEFEIVLPSIAVVADTEPQRGHPALHRPKRILIIEDNEDAAASLRDVLEILAGHEVHVAPDGAAGVDAARSLAPDVILCDLGLPTLDGFEVARRLNSTAAWGPTLIALSGYASMDDVERSRAAGFDHHLAKPPNIDALLRMISDAPERVGAQPG